MTAKEIRPGVFQMEINNELHAFRLAPLGIVIEREFHQDDRISYQDLTAKVEGQLTLPIAST